MSKFTLALIMMLALQQGEPAPYKDGTFCSPKGDIIMGHQTTDHPCSCKRHDMADQTDPDNHKMCKAGEATDPSHDSICKQFCSEQHCACPITCETHTSGQERR